MTYDVLGFLEKNRDTLSANLLETMRNSESQMVCDLFTAPLSNTGALQLKYVPLPVQHFRSKAPRARKKRSSLSSALCMHVSCFAFCVTRVFGCSPDVPKRHRKSILLCKPKDLSHTKTRSLSKRAGKKLKEK